jgi:hypothetical protein
MNFNIILFFKIVLIKGPVSRDFLSSGFFHESSHFNIRVSFKFFQKLSEVFASQGAPQVSTAPVAIHISADLTPVSMTLAVNCHRCIRLITPLCELEEKLYLFVNSTTQKCSNKIFKTFLFEDCFHLPPIDTGGAP